MKFLLLAKFFCFLAGGWGDERVGLGLGRMGVNMRSRAGGRGHMIIILYMSVYGYVFA